MFLIDISFDQYTFELAWKGMLTIFIAIAVIYFTIHFILFITKEKEE